MAINYRTIQYLLFFLLTFTWNYTWASELLVYREVHSYVVTDLKNYSSSLSIEGVNQNDVSSYIPISVLETSTLKSIELYVEQNGKRKRINLEKNITESTMDFSSFFSGLKNYILEIPGNSSFEIKAEMMGVETIFLTRMDAEGSYGANYASYSFELADGLTLSASNGQNWERSIELSSNDIGENNELSYLIHPTGTDPVEYFENWFRKRIEPQLTLDKQLVPKELVWVSENESRLNLAKACFSYVKEQIKYIAIENGINAIIPRRCESVLEKKIGDCKDMATLLTALYSHFGFEAYFTISCTNSRGSKFDFPSLGEANHVICSLRMDDAWYFLDPTEDVCIFGDPSVQILGTEAFLIGHSSERFIHVPENPRSLSYAELHYSFNKQNARLELQINASGKMNNLFYSLQLKQHKPLLSLEKIFKLITEMEWTADTFVSVDTLSSMSLSTPINSAMFSTIGKRIFYDLKFVPTIDMLTRLFYGNDYPAFTSTLDLKIYLDGELQFAMDEYESESIDIVSVNNSILHIKLTLTETESEAEFSKSSIHREWDNIWSKPIIVTYEN